MSIVILEPWWYHDKFDWRLSFNTLALCMIRVQGFGAVIFLVFWNFFGYRLRFLRRLTDAACGAGIIKARKTIEKVNISLIILIFITIIISSTFQLLHAFKVNTPLAEDTIDHLSLLPIILLVITTLFCLIAVMNSMSVISIHFSIICAEYDKLAEEFKEDVNTFQLPVVTHYSHAHQNIWRLWMVIKGIMSYYQTFNLLSNIILFVYLCSTVKFDKSWIDFVIGLYFILYSVSSIGITFVFVSSFRRSFKRLHVEFLNLSGSGKILHEGVYAFMPVFTHSIQRKIYRLRLFGLIDINIRTLLQFLVLCVAASCVIRLLLYRDDFNKLA